MVASASLHAHQHLKGVMTFCSWKAGWRALLLRAYDDPPHVEGLITPETRDQLVVLVTAGSFDIQSYSKQQWCSAAYRPGTLGLTAPGEAAKLRWAADEGHSTLQLHLPAATMVAVASELLGASARQVSFPHKLLESDPVVAEVMLSLGRAAHCGAPELYAETAAQFLASHLITRHAGLAQRSARARHGSNLREVDDYMRANLASGVTLAELADVAGLSRFQLLRAASAAWGETPLRRLTRLRMQLAQRLLSTTQIPVIAIALECGYGNPAHFATAFGRHVGTTPSCYRHG